MRSRGICSFSWTREAQQARHHQGESLATDAPISADGHHNPFPSEPSIRPFLCCAGSASDASWRTQKSQCHVMAESEAGQAGGDVTPPQPAAALQAAHSPSRAQRFLSAVRQLFRPAQPLPPALGVGSSSSDGGGGGGRDARAPGDLLLEEAEPSPNEDCPICLVSLEEAVISTPCGHKFHAECLDKYFLTAREPGSKARCPLCRSTCHAPLPVEVSATSRRPIEVVSVPARGAQCHYDRPYTFISLGGFAERPNMLYVMTSNEDRKTPRDRVMWTLESARSIIVHLNFRSAEHVRNGTRGWPTRGGSAVAEAFWAYICPLFSWLVASPNLLTLVQYSCSPRCSARLHRGERPLALGAWLGAKPHPRQHHHFGHAQWPLQRARLHEDMPAGQDAALRIQ